MGVVGRYWVCICTVLVLLVQLSTLRLRGHSDELIIIIGAGAAGLAAAQALADTVEVVVLEARERLGGRVHTDHSLGAAAELGAVWIHRAEGNVVTELAERFGCRRFQSQNKALRLYDEAGREYGAHEVRSGYETLTRDVMPELLRKRAALGGADRDMQSLLREIPPFARLPRAADAAAGRRRCILDFLLFRDVVQDHTADLAQSSAAHYDNDLYGGSGKDELLPAGYDCIINGLAHGLNVQTGLRGEVVGVRWRGGQAVEVQTADGRVRVAARVIVAVPLGVLKAGLKPGLHMGEQPDQPPRGAIRFDPPLPPYTEHAIRQLGFGEATKVALRFSHFFWPRDAHFLGKVAGGCDDFGSSRHMEFLNVGAYSGEPVLLMETETANARRLAALDDAGAVGAVMAELRRMFPGAPWPIRSVVARLGNESFQRGGFSYMPAHGSPDLFEQLALPLYGSRLFLAGEHTSAYHPGTVHGAVVSGRLAAAQVHGAIFGDRLEGARYAEGYLQRLRREQEGQAEGEERWDRNP